MMSKEFMGIEILNALKAITELIFGSGFLLPCFL